jgi:HEAT repeat protein
LGFSNNPAAIDALVDMTKSAHEYIRLAAISSLGTINAKGQVEHLIALFNGESIWQDRAMAVKSLGDIAVMGDERAMAFLQNDVEPKLQGESAAGAEWVREILGLYLRN